MNVNIPTMTIKIDKRATLFMFINWNTLEILCSGKDRVAKKCHETVFEGDGVIHTGVFLSIIKVAPILQHHRYLCNTTIINRFNTPDTWAAITSQCRLTSP